MDDFFAFLVLLSMLAIVVGIVNPRLVIRWGANKTRKRVFMTYGLMLIGSFFLFGVFVESPPDKTNELVRQSIQQPIPTPPTVVEVSPTRISIPTLGVDDFNNYVSQLNGGVFISRSEIHSNVAQIRYYESYEQYEAENPQSRHTQQSYENYWETGDAINKALMENSIRLFKEFPTLTEVSISLPHKGQEFHAAVARSDAEAFLGVDFMEIHYDRSNETWREELSNRYFNPQDRKRFIDRFVKVHDFTSSRRPSEGIVIVEPTRDISTTPADSAEKYSPEYKLAVIHRGGYVPEGDPLVETFRLHLDVLHGKTGEERIRISDIVVTAQKLMKQKGVNEDLLTLIQALEASLPDEMTPGVIKLEEIASAYVVLRTGG